MPVQRGAPARDPAALGAQAHRRITSGFRITARWLQSPLLQVSALCHTPPLAKMCLNSSPCNPTNPHVFNAPALVLVVSSRLSDPAPPPNLFIYFVLCSQWTATSVWYQRLGHIQWVSVTVNALYSSSWVCCAMYSCNGIKYLFCIYPDQAKVVLPNTISLCQYHFSYLHVSVTRFFFPCSILIMRFIGFTW